MTFLQALAPDTPPDPGDAWAIVTAASTPCPHGNPGTVADNQCCRQLWTLLIRHDWPGFHRQHTHDREHPMTTGHDDQPDPGPATPPARRRWHAARDHVLNHDEHHGK